MAKRTDTKKPKVAPAPPPPPRTASRSYDDTGLAASLDRPLGDSDPADNGFDTIASGPARRQPDSTAFTARSYLGLSAPPNATDLAESRQFDRFPWARTVLISWLSANNWPTAPVKVQTTDISSSGLGLLCRGMVYPLTRGVVLLDRGHGQLMLRCIEVIHCRYDDRFRHSVGTRWIPMPAGIPIAAQATEAGAKLIILE